VAVGEHPPPGKRYLGTESNSAFTLLRQWRDAMKSALKHKAEKTAKRPAPKRQQTLLAVDAMLDEALDETFPASDPVALTQPSRRRRAALKQPAGHGGAVPAAKRRPLRRTTGK
jgi:membrane carboxypeptidase/penicillin-binding protein